MLGGFAEVAVAPPWLTFALPDALDFAQGAGLILNYHTAYFSLKLRGRLAEGETVLVHGAAGGVGTAALQIAKGLGAKTIAVVSSDAKEQVAREAGADEVVRSDGPWKDEAKELSGGGVDVVLDPVGGDRFTDSLRSLREGGRAVVVGFTGGSIPEVRVNRLLLNNIEVVGAGWGAFVLGKPELNQESAPRSTAWPKRASSSRSSASASRSRTRRRRSRPSTSAARPARSCSSSKGEAPRRRGGRAGRSPRARRPRPAGSRRPASTGAAAPRDAGAPARRPTSRCWRSAARPPGPLHWRRTSPASGPQRWTWPKTHPVGVHAEPVDDPGQRGDARAAHLRAQRALGERREATAERAPRAARHRGGAQQLGQLVHELRQRARQPPGQQRLDARRRRAALVVGRRRPVARQAAEQPAGDAVRRLGQQVAIEVVPVRGPDAIGEPDARIAHAHARGLEPRRQRGPARASRRAGSGCRRRATRRAPAPTGARTRRRGCPARR